MKNIFAYSIRCHKSTQFVGRAPASHQTNSLQQSKELLCSFSGLNYLLSNSVCCLQNFFEGFICIFMKLMNITSRSVSFVSTCLYINSIQQGLRHHCVKHNLLCPSRIQTHGDSYEKQQPYCFHWL